MERFLHGVNVGGCCLQMVTGAVELFSLGGAQTVTTAVLDALAMHKTPKEQTEIAERMVAALEAHLADAQTPEAVQRQVVQVLDRFTPAQTDIARGDVDAVKIAGQMRGQVAAEAIDPEHREPEVLEAYEAALVAVLTPLCAPQTQAQANDQEMLGRLAASEANQQAMMAQLTQLIHAKNEDQPLRDAGISEAVILDLARKASVSTDNLEQAWIDLLAFFKAALQVQEQAPATNHDDFVDDVIALTRELAAKGEYSPALDAIGDALARGCRRTSGAARGVRGPHRAPDAAAAQLAGAERPERGGKIPCCSGGPLSRRDSRCSGAAPCARRILRAGPRQRDSSRFADCD